MRSISAKNVQIGDIKWKCQTTFSHLFLQLLFPLSLPLQLLLKSLQVSVVIQAHAVVGGDCPKTVGVVGSCNGVGEVVLLVIVRVSLCSAPVSLCKLLY